MSEREAVEREACEHEVVWGYQTESEPVSLWACQSCKLRFYPACPTCVDVGHRNVVHPLSSPETTPAGVLPPNTRLILASDNLLDHLGTRTEHGERITAEWREPSPEGWYEPLFTVHSDDRIGVLDEAWAAAEKALPEGWSQLRLTLSRGTGDCIASVHDGSEAAMALRTGLAIGSGPTPAAALHALAAALGRSGSGGGPG